MTRKQIVANTLRWCNAQRRKRGMEPLAELPKGRRVDRHSCPCGKATGIGVGYVHATARLDDGRLLHLRLPQSVRQFTKRFDEGDFPEYDETRA